MQTYKTEKLLTALLLVLISTNTQAASVSLVRHPDLPAAEVDEFITVEIWGDFSGVTGGVLGGGLDVLFDNGLLPFVSYAWSGEGDPAFSREPDVGPGELTGIAVGDFSCQTNLFLIGTVTFLAADAGGPTTIAAQQNATPAGSWVGCTTFTVVNPPETYSNASIEIFEVVDSDGDGLRDAPEVNLGTDRLDPDSDNDGRPDGTDDDPLVATPNFCTGDDAIIGPYTVDSNQILDCRAQDSITSESNFVVKSGGEALFMSQQVILSAGFRVRTGGTFTAVSATEIAN